MWWGDADSLVSRAHTEYLATAVTHAELEIHAGDGHLLLVPRWSEMLASLH